MAKGISHKRNEKAISTVAFNIKKNRLEQKLTIQELANLIDVDYSQIGRIERGIVNPNISIIFDIAAALNIKPSELVKTESLLI